VQTKSEILVKLDNVFSGMWWHLGSPASHQPKETVIDTLDSAMLRLGFERSHGNNNREKAKCTATKIQTEAKFVSVFFRGRARIYIAFRKIYSLLLNCF
jgi:hypothetical protein